VAGDRGLKPTAIIGSSLCDWKGLLTFRGDDAEGWEEFEQKGTEATERRGMGTGSVGVG
jgi:hypothetical protein